ncbi:MAG: tRNA (N6-isopentenyl adenosine(37)-C2)-methylthiotransferase MiaB [Sphingobacteriales bacterium]|nr:tRNA (N6-isopentenyl adenosine(37)-C2)-methylthiotransferase MiaB [Sphingobacteriales bacterium]
MFESTHNGTAHNVPLQEERQGEVLAMPLVAAANGKRFYIESYGCQMNFSDSEIVASVLYADGYGITDNYQNADVILLNTCSIREKAEERVRHRLQQLSGIKKQNPNAVVGLLGCMAERLKSKLIEEERLVDVVCGPDAYRDLPRLLAEAEGGQRAVNVLLSREETYANIAPVRLDANGVSAFISIMRGCDNMCSFCVVPFTRGRERSRDSFSIVAEAQDLFNRGYREVTLLGQNVDSYKWQNPESGEHINFAKLLEMTAQVNPLLRVRFSTSHPKDITNEVLEIMAKHDNICKYIHLPVQSGNSRILDLMNRTYDREWYLERVAAIRRYMPDCGISTDVISGFCSETEAEHQDTLSLMEIVKYDMAYMFAYSERPGTLAARKYADDVDEAVKKRRLNEVIALQNAHSFERNQADVGKIYEVLVEKTSKRSDEEMCGRNSQNKMIIFPKGNAEAGQYVQVRVTDCTSASLRGVLVQ